MSYSPSFSIAVEKQDVVIRFSREAIDQDALGRFLDYLELESIRRHSQFTEDQAAALASEVDHAVWDNIKHAFAGT